jgi:hypothetical protein
MEEDEEVTETQTIDEIEATRLICGNVECIRDGVIERLEVKPDMPIPMHP